MSVNKTQQTPNAVLQICPLLSANSEYNKMCVQDRCAWYMKSTKTCAVSVMAHKNILEIKNIQSNKPQTNEN